MSYNPPQREDGNEEFRVWGDGMIVSHWGDEGEWVMYDPETDVVNIADWA